MKFCLLINPAHHWQACLHEALALASTMDQQGQTVHSVFFYGSSVLLSTDSQWLECWQSIQNTHQTRLMICRTMLDHHDQEPPVSPAFEVVGMASLASAMEQADRIVELT